MTISSRSAPPTVQILGSTRLARVAMSWLVDQGRARVVGLDPGEEDESRPWFAPVRGLARDYGIPLGRSPAEVTLDLDPDARPSRGEGVMVRVLAPARATSADVNRVFLVGGDWQLTVCNAEGTAAWVEVPLPWEGATDATEVLERATLTGIEALADVFPALLEGAEPTPLTAPLKPGRWRPQENFLLWERSAEAIAARVRASSGPWGGGRTNCGSTTLWFEDACALTSDRVGDLPGTVVAIDTGLTVAAASGLVRVERLRPGWRPVRRAGDWAREVGLSPGYQLG